MPLITSNGNLKNARALYFADDKKKPKHLYLLYINPSHNYKIDYKNFDLFSLKKIEFSGYIHYFDLNNKFIQSNSFVEGKLVKIFNKKMKDKTRIQDDKKLQPRYELDPCYWYMCTFYYDNYTQEWKRDDNSCDLQWYDPSLSGCDSGGGGGGGGIDCTDPFNSYLPECGGGGIDCTNPINANLPDCGGGGGVDCSDPIWANTSQCSGGTFDENVLDFYIVEIDELPCPNSIKFRNLGSSHVACVTDQFKLLDSRGNGNYVPLTFCITIPTFYWNEQTAQNFTAYHIDKAKSSARDYAHDMMNMGIKTSGYQIRSHVIDHLTSNYNDFPGMTVTGSACSGIDCNELTYSGIFGDCD